MPKRALDDDPYYKEEEDDDYEPSGEWLLLLYVVHGHDGCSPECWMVGGVNGQTRMWRIG